MAQKTKSRRRKKTVSSIGTWQQIWGSLDERMQHAVSVLFLILVSFGFYAPIHFSSGHLIAGDTVQWRSMANDMLEYEEEHGEAALWSINSFGGMPGYMISYPVVVPQLDFAVSFMRSLMWPSSHLILLFLGMYWLVWALVKNKLAAVFSSVSFGLTTYLPVILLAGHNTKFVALAWAPWLLLAFILVLRKPGLLTGLFFAVIAAVNLRAGHVQITYYVVVICVVWWLAELIRARRSGNIRLFGRATVVLIVASAGTLLMLAQPYWAFADFKPYTIRGASPGGAPGGLSWDYAMAWSQGAGEMLTLLIANAFGGVGSLYWGPKSFTGGPHYFGGLTIAIALYAALRCRTVAVAALWASALLMTLFALGENFQFLNRLAFEYLPLFGTIRVPETWLSAVSMNVSILAGIGIASLSSGARTKSGKVDAATGDDRSLAVAFGAMGAIVLILLLASDVFMEFTRPDESVRIFSQLRQQVPDISPDDPRIAPVINQEIARLRTERKAVFMIDTQRTLFFLVTGFIFLFLMRRRKIFPWLATTGLILLVSFDLGGVGRRFINEGNLTASSSAAEAVRRYAFDEYLMERADEVGGSGRFRVLSLEMGRDPGTNARPSYFYESLGGYSGAKLRSYQDFLDHILFLADRSRLNPNALAIMNVRFLVGRRPAPGYELVFQDDATGQTVFENPTIPDRAFFVGSAEVITSAEKIWERLRDPGFDPRETVLLSVETGLESSPIDSTSTTHVQLLTHTNREIEWRVETDRPRWLVISEVYYPAGWIASIDDEETAIVRSNYLNRAVFVPSGTHQIRMRFDPPSHKIGVWVSGVSTALIYGLLLFLLLQSFLSGRFQRADSGVENGSDRERTGSAG